MSILTLLAQSPAAALIFLASIVAAITVHEFAHAWTADYLGDDTPALQGRVTLNPLAHLDPVGSIAFLIFGFGWGRPVIYNPMRLSRKVDELLIALAGPASNLLFAFGLNLLGFATRHSFPAFSQFIQYGPFGDGIGPVQINILLASFNMIPIPPLDGSSIVAYFWPEYRSIVGGQIGLILLLVILYVPFQGGSLIGYVIGPVEHAFSLLTSLYGLLGG